MQGLVKVASGLHRLIQGGAQMRNEYEANSAVTFLMLGLGIGTVLALVCNPRTRQRAKPEGFNRRRAADMQPRNAQPPSERATRAEEGNWQVA